MATSYRKSAVDTIFIGGATIVQFIVGLLTMPLISKTMGAEGYGIWAQMNSAISLILPITNLGLGVALIRFLAAEKRREEIQEGFYSVIIVLFAVNLIAGLTVILLAGPIALHFFGGVTQVVRLTGILVILATLVETYTILLRTFQWVKFLSVFMVADTIVFTGIMAFMVLNGYGISYVAYAYVGVKLLEFAALFFLIRAKIGIKWPRFSRLKEFLGYGLTLTPRNIAYWIITASDRYIIGYFLSTAAVGIYSAGYSLGNLPYSITAVLGFTMMATLPKLYDEGKLDEVRTHLSYTLKYFLAIAIPFIVGSAIIGEDVLTLFSIPDIARQGYVVVPIIATAVSILCVHNIIFYILLLVKKTKMLVVIWVIAAPVSIGLNFWLIPALGIIGAAYSMLITYSIATVIVIYLSIKELTFYFDWRFMIKSIISSAVMAVAIWFIHFDGRTGVIYVAVIGIAVYWAALILLKGFSRSEFRFFKGLAKRPDISKID